MIKGKHINRTFYVKGHHEEYSFIISKMPKFTWMKHTDSNYMYFLYISRSVEDFVDKTKQKEEYLCFHKVYFDFGELIRGILPVLREYILDNVKLFKLLSLCEQLKEPNEDPLHVTASGE